MGATQQGEAAMCGMVEGDEAAYFDEGTCSLAFSGQAPAVGTQLPLQHLRQCPRPISALSARGPSLRLLPRRATKAPPC